MKRQARQRTAIDHRSINVPDKRFDMTLGRFDIVQNWKMRESVSLNPLEELFNTAVRTLHDIYAIQSMSYIESLSYVLCPSNQVENELLVHWHLGMRELRVVDAETARKSPSRN